MRERLPVIMDDLELPNDNYVPKKEKKVSYGFVSVLYLLSLMITVGSLITVLIFKR